MSKHDSNTGIRITCFIKILCGSVNGQVFSDKENVIAITGVSASQAGAVWDALIEYGVLRKENGFYSALPWLEENGFIGKDEKKTHRNRESPRENRKGQESNNSEEKKAVVEGEAAEAYKRRLLEIVGAV